MGSYKPKVDNVKLVKVIVESDPMSIPEIAECLRRIVPVENFSGRYITFRIVCLELNCLISLKLRG
jgi:hypothetical protein